MPKKVGEGVIYEASQQGLESQTSYQSISL